MYIYTSEQMQQERERYMALYAQHLDLVAALAYHESGAAGRILKRLQSEGATGAASALEEWIATAKPSTDFARESARDRRARGARERGTKVAPRRHSVAVKS